MKERRQQNEISWILIIFTIQPKNAMSLDAAFFVSFFGVCVLACFDPMNFVIISLLSIWIFHENLQYIFLNVSRTSRFLFLLFVSFPPIMLFCPELSTVIRFCTWKSFSARIWFKMNVLFFVPPSFCYVVHMIDNELVGASSKRNTIKTASQTQTTDILHWVIER